MRSIKPLVLFVLLLSSPFTMDVARGQAVPDTVRGMVTDAETGDPLPGANVVIQGTTRGVATSVNGTYTLALPPDADTLVVSYVGYRQKSVPLAGRSVIDVELQPATLRGEEVVVVGYTNQQRKNISGAVSSITARELDTRKVTSLPEALEGRLPGVIVNSTGEPGERSRIIVRGVSFIGSNSPLWVVDGMYMRENPNINPANIASIQVLKDAAAAAQYGALAANGVIVITTKKGQAGMTRVNFGAYYGFQEIPTRIDMMEAEEWAEINNMAHENAGVPLMPGASTHFDGSINTDWQDALFTPGSVQKYNLGVSGGNKAATYRLSAGYLTENGTIMSTGFERFSLRLNSEFTRDFFTIGESVSLSRSVKEHMDGSPFLQTLRMLPVIPVYDSSTVSGYGYGNDINVTFGTNPIGMQEERDAFRYSNQVIGSIYGELQLLDFLSYRANVGLVYKDVRHRAFTGNGRIRMRNPQRIAQLEVRDDRVMNLLWENLLRFNGSFGGHSVEAVAGITEQRKEYRMLQATRKGYPHERYRVIDAGRERTDNRGFQTVATTRSYLLRTQYNYEERYLLTGTIRRDGSSKFGTGRRFGTFLSGSVGWVLSEEEFYASIPILGDYVDYFKLRASYGELGSSDIARYARVGNIRREQDYTFGSTEQEEGAIQTSLNNADIRWQENRQLNFGVNLDLFNYRLSIDANYYRSVSDGLLIQAPLPPSLGSEENPFVNIGSILNEGLELAVEYDYDGRDFQLSAGANLTSIHNEVLQLGNGNQPLFVGPSGVARTAVGYSIGHLYVRKTDGLFQSEEEVEAHCAQPEAQPGDIRYVDFNGDCVIDGDDRYVAGSAFPDFEGGFSLNASYKNFDFTVLLRGRLGGTLYNWPKRWATRTDEDTNYLEGLDPWTSTDRDANAPRAVNGSAGAPNQFPRSDRYLEDASYLRIQNIELGYRVPASLLRSVGMGRASIRLYANVQNLYTFTGYSGWDPTITGTDILALSVDAGQTYPDPRTLTFGVRVRFL